MKRDLELLWAFFLLGGCMAGGSIGLYSSRFVCGRRNPDYMRLLGSCYMTMKLKQYQFSQGH